jgi:hypothetical protein
LTRCVCGHGGGATVQADDVELQATRALFGFNQKGPSPVPSILLLLLLGRALVCKRTWTFACDRSGGPELQLCLYVKVGERKQWIDAHSRPPPQQPFCRCRKKSKAFVTPKLPQDAISKITIIPGRVYYYFGLLFHGQQHVVVLMLIEIVNTLLRCSNFGFNLPL